MTPAEVPSPNGRRPTAKVVDQDLACAACGHNLRGMAEDARCPECGRPVGATLEGTGLDAGARESAAEALRNLGKGSLLLAGAPLAMVSCIGPVLVLASVAGSFQRFLAGRSLAPVLEDGAERSRGRVAAAAELGTGAFALAVAFAPESILPAAIAPAVASFASALWIGALAAGSVAAWESVDSAIARHALDVERRKLPAALALAALPPLVVAWIARPVGAAFAGWAATAGTLAGTGLWAASCVLLAQQAGTAGDEIAVGPRRRRLRAPDDAAPAAPGSQRAAARKAAEDDSPIPMD